MSVCRRCLSVGTKSASSPDPGRSFSAKYLQARQNVEQLTALCFFLLDTLYKHLKSCVLSVGTMGMPIDYKQIPGHLYNVR